MIGHQYNLDRLSLVKQQVFARVTEDVSVGVDEIHSSPHGGIQIRVAKRSEHLCGLRNYFGATNPHEPFDSAISESEHDAIIQFLLGESETVAERFNRYEIVVAQVRGEPELYCADVVDNATGTCEALAGFGTLREVVRMVDSVRPTNIDASISEAERVDLPTRWCD